MKTRRTVLIFSFFLIYLSSYSQTLSDEEKKLYDIIMQFRSENGLPKIELSSSLTFVAQTHVKDLADNKPDSDYCNSHSWSSKGKWTAVCYTRDHSQAKYMWSKPRELTSYAGNGYEISAGSNVCCSDFVMTADHALNSWKSSKGHREVIINEGIWNSKKWNAIGIGLYKGFSVVWFGEEFDTKQKM